MKDPNDLRQRAGRADRYRRWFDEDGLADVFAAMRDQYVQEIVKTPVENTRRLQAYRMALGVVDQVAKHIEMVIRRGELSAKELKLMEKSAKGQQSWM